MSSPFTIFRRHQRVLLAVVGVLAMIAFVFFPSISPQLGGSSRDNPVVVDTAYYGELRESDLASLADNRELARRFLTVIADTLARQQVEPLQLGESQKNRLLNMFVFQRRGDSLAVMNLTREQLMNAGQPLGAAPAVETFVLAKTAESVGIVVSDTVINDFLSQIVGNSLTRDEIKQVIAELGPPGFPVSEARLFQALRVELLANEYRSMFAADLRPITPGQRWDYFLRVNLRATIEALSIPVANFLSQVREPETQELRSLFVQHKNELPSPESPDPGFKEPQKIVVQFFMANVDDFIRRAEADVTDAQIADFYEKNKALQFRKVALPPEPDSSKPPAGEAKPLGEGAGPADSGKPAAGETQTDAKPASPAETTPAAPGEATPNRPATPAPGDRPNPETAPPAPDSTPQKAGDGKSSAAPRSSLLRLASAEEKATTGDSAPAAPEPPATSGASPAEGASPAGVAAPAAGAAESKPAGETAEAKPAEPVEYEPLEKVKDTIRISLAREAAGNQINAALDALQNIMAEYADQRVVEEPEDNAESEPAAKKPAGPKPPDFQALAKQYGLEAYEKGPISAREAYDETSIGRSTPRDSALRGQNFLSLMFGDGISLYTPLRTSDAHREFLSWKIRSIAEHTPTFDEARPQVERAWKLIEARAIADKTAKQYMAEAQREKRSLQAIFGSDPSLRVLKPAPFSWITFGAVPRENEPPQPRFGTVEGIEMAGENFMRAVFRLSPGDFAVTKNGPETMVYLVHLLEYDRALDNLLAQFGEEKDFRFMSLANIDSSQIFRSWIDGLMKDAGVHWRRDPQALSDRRR